MNPLGPLALGFAPGLFWLWIIYQRDRYLPCPVSLVVRTFLWGVVVAFPIALVEFVLTGFGLLIAEKPQSLFAIGYLSFIVAGVTEEFGKYTIVRRTLYDSPYFLESKDGLIYASAAALGFASLENVFYMLEFGWQIIFVRGPFSTLAHVVFASLWGYALGREKEKGKSSLTALALAGGMGLHGLFDFFLFSEGATGAVAIFWVGSVLFLFLLRRSIARSATGRRIASALISCPGCTKRWSIRARFCPDCGHALTHQVTKNSAACSICSLPLKPAYRFCPSCSSRVDWKGRPDTGLSRTQPEFSDS